MPFKEPQSRRHLDSFKLVVWACSQKQKNKVNLFLLTGEEGRGDRTQPTEQLASKILLQGPWKTVMPPGTHLCNV